MANDRPTLKGTNKENKEKEKKNTLTGVIATPSGNSIEPVYKRVYDKELDKSLVKKVDTLNITEFIQASKSQTDLSILEKRFIELGEIPNASPDLGSHDLTNMPGDIHSLYAMANDISGNFAKLPQSVQEVFGNPQAYMKSIIDGTYQSTLINAFNAKKTEKKEVEKKGDPE